MKLLAALAQAGFGPCFGVPCSFLPAPPLVANNEGEAIALAAGAWLGGARPAVLMQNSGLGNAVNPITSLLHPFGIPLLLGVSWRGEPGQPDEPQHGLMGSIMHRMLDLMEIPHALLSEDAIEAARRRTEGSFALVVPRGALEREAAPPAAWWRRETQLLPEEAGHLPTRAQVLQTVLETVSPETLLIATTGKTGRELFTLGDSPRSLYVVGSMGCASSLALGLALQVPEKRVIVLDGDGAALMRLEAMASIGARAPRNLVHCILDNQAHDSTGGQATLSGAVSFPQVAAACGYATAGTVSDLPAHLARTAQTPGPHLLHLRIQTGSLPDLGRPTITPYEVARRFRTEAGGVLR